MQRPIRVVLADDSIVVRRILLNLFERHPEMEVVGTAKTGREAVNLSFSMLPDVLLLDVEMPEMNGVEAVGEIRKYDRDLPVIMFSAITIEGGTATLEALTRGANDYVTKPSHVTENANFFNTVDIELISKVRFWGQRRQRSTNTLRPMLRLPAQKRSDPQLPQDAVHSVDIIAIGVSTGGPNALVEILSKFPKNLSVPVVIVQHMPPVFTALLATRLNQIGPVPVREAGHQEKLEPGTVLIAPGNRHLQLACQDGVVFTELSDGPPVNSCRPAVDNLFQTVAKIYRERVLGIVLTGMGKDGLEGARAIKAAQGRVIAQDEMTSVVWGMPRAVIEAGLADRVVSLSHVADEVRRSTMALTQQVLTTHSI